ncbi:hypothetical protein Droror1_Dr00000893 [Drosera rotundifolia]
MPQALPFTPLLPLRLHPRPGPTCRAHTPSRKKNGDDDGDGGGGGGGKRRKKEGLKWKCVEGCGACCKLYKDPIFATPEEIFQNQDDVELYRSLIGSDGWCKHYDKRTRTCSIYADRPYICRAEPEIFKTLYGISERKFDKEACRSFGYRESSDQAAASIFNRASKSHKGGTDSGPFLLKVKAIVEVDPRARRESLYGIVHVTLVSHELRS